MDRPPDMSDDRIAELLRSIVDDEAVRAPNREAVRTAFLDEIGPARTGEPADIFDLDTGEHRAVARRPSRGHLIVPLVAAAVLILVLGIAAAVRIAGDVEEPVASLPDPTVPSVDLVPIGGQLPVGTVFSSLAGGIRFDLDESAVLRERSGDHITLSFRADDGAEVTVSLVETDPGEFRAGLSDAVAREELRIDPAVYRVDSLRIEVTPNGMERWGCDAGSACRLGDLSITVAVGGDDVDNFVTTVDLGDDAGLVVVERYDSPPASIDPEVSDLLGRPGDPTVRRRDRAAPILDSIAPWWETAPQAP